MRKRFAKHPYTVKRETAGLEAKRRTVGTPTPGICVRKRKKTLFKGPCLYPNPGSVALSPIHEAPNSSHKESAIGCENQRGLQHHTCAVECASASVLSGLTICDSTSDLVMPSGVSSFLVNCLDSSSAASSSPCDNTSASFSSPEVFRTEKVYDDETRFLTEEDMTGVQVKNSTLLDVSHAVHINMRQPPNISAILETTGNLDEKNIGTSHQAEKNPTCATSVASGATNKTSLSSERTLQATEKPRPIKYKKVTFQSVHLEPRHEPQISPREALRIEGPQTDVSHKTARFFPLTDSAERIAVMQKKRATGMFMFPSKSVISSSSPAPHEIQSVHVKFTNSEVHGQEELLEVCWLQLLCSGKDLFNTPRFEKVTTDYGIFYEDHQRIQRYNGQVFFTCR